MRPTGLESTREQEPAPHLQELGELWIAEEPLPLVAKVQPDELTVPVERDVVVHRGLAEDVAHILCGAERKKSER